MNYDPPTKVTSFCGRTKTRDANMGRLTEVEQVFHPHSHAPSSNPRAFAKKNSKRDTAFSTIPWLNFDYSYYYSPTRNLGNKMKSKKPCVALWAQGIRRERESSPMEYILFRIAHAVLLHFRSCWHYNDIELCVGVAVGGDGHAWLGRSTHTYGRQDDGILLWVSSWKHVLRT